MKTVAATHELPETQRHPLLTAISRLFAHWRSTGNDRALRRQLAEMDDALLRDIGIAEDEIWRVRNLETFTPRAWR